MTKSKKRGRQKDRHTHNYSLYICLTDRQTHAYLFTIDMPASQPARQTDRQTGRQTGRQTVTKSEKEGEGKTERQTHA